jgi:hypothetical protein
MISAQRQNSMEEKADVKDSGALNRIRNLLVRIEDGFLVSLLALMIILAVMQIVLRNIFEAGIFIMKRKTDKTDISVFTFLFHKIEYSQIINPIPSFFV